MIDWFNAEPFGVRVSRIEVLIALLGLLCIAYYGYQFGLIGALKGGVAYIMTMMLGWFLRELFIER